jgi:hypothetical protein
VIRVGSPGKFRYIQTNAVGKVNFTVKGLAAA